MKNKTKKTVWGSFYSSSHGVVYVGGTDSEKVARDMEELKEGYRKAGAKVK